MPQLSHSSETLLCKQDEEMNQTCFLEFSCLANWRNGAEDRLGRTDIMFYIWGVWPDGEGSGAMRCCDDSTSSSPITEREGLHRLDESHWIFQS